MADDLRFMQLALALGRRGLGRTWPNPSVGTVIVKDGVIVGRGWTQPGGRPHAETEALRRAGEAARGATLYVTLEPCSHHGKTPPCADAIVAAGVARVVSSLVDPNIEVAGKGHRRMAEAGIVVDIGLGAEEARRVHAGHIRRVRDGRPNVTLKLAVSADDKVALAGRQPVRITGEAARERVHLMRAMNDAIMVGIGTAIADDPMLNCRLPGMADRSPVRVVFDRDLRLPAKGALASSARQIPLWVVTSIEAPAEQERVLKNLGAEIIRVMRTAAGLDLPATLKELSNRGITRLLVEGGPTIATSFLKSDLIDEAVIFRGPGTIGPAGVDAFEELPLDALTRSPKLKRCGMEMLGPDRVETFERA
jgi:diaminohydroxyphosphoribosylaminopyrimidine deaminase/5-amino-6-(5-phosphoribosylamino)uracil reductase